MRDPRRISPTLELVAQVWRKYPDMRLPQLLSFIANIYGLEPMHMEEEELYQAIKSHLKKLKEEKI